MSDPRAKLESPFKTVGGEDVVRKGLNSNVHELRTETLAVFAVEIAAGTAYGLFPRRSGSYARSA